MLGGGRGEAINGGQVHGNRKSDLRKFLKHRECRLMPINSQSGGDVAATEWMCVIEAGSCRASLRLPSNLSDMFKSGYFFWILPFCPHENKCFVFVFYL